MGGGGGCATSRHVTHCANKPHAHILTHDTRTQTARTEPGGPEGHRRRSRWADAPHTPDANTKEPQAPLTSRADAQYTQGAERPTDAHADAPNWLRPAPPWLTQRPGPPLAHAGASPPWLTQRPAPPWLTHGWPTQTPGHARRPRTAARGHQLTGDRGHQLMGEGGPTDEGRGLQLIGAPTDGGRGEKVVGGGGAPTDKGPGA